MINDPFSLQGRVALVTDGSRGFGRMIAEGFLRQGARRQGDHTASLTAATLGVDVGLTLSRSRRA